MKGSISYAPYERKLRFPFRYGQRSVDSRHGYILRRNLDGKPRYAEAAPLPGHSKETFEDVARCLERGKDAAPPSIRFALESLEAVGGKAFPIRSNALLQGKNEEDASAELSRFRKLGYSHCKVKLGTLSIPELTNLIDTHSTFIFRLDANQTLSPSSLDALIQNLDQRSLLDRIDYLEEPFEDIWNDSAFRNAPLAFAADESVQDGAAAGSLLNSLNPPRVMILKPSVHGSLESLSSLLDLLKVKKTRAVITSAIETEVGRRAILTFLSRQPQEVAGLSTGFLFQDSFLEDRPSWLAVPDIAPAEQAWLDSLAWRESKW